MRVLLVLSPEFRRLPPALNGIVHHNVNRESWSVEASPYRAIGASATDCVVNPTFGGPFFNPGDFGSASADKSCGLSLRWTIPRPGCSSRNSRTLVSGTYSVFVVRVPGWIRWVKLNFSSAVSELSTGSKELADGEMWGGEILVVTDLFC